MFMIIYRIVLSPTNVVIDTAVAVMVLPMALTALDIHSYIR